MTEKVTCPRCKGRGYTEKEAPVVIENKIKHPGSGCTLCLGICVINKK